MPPPPVSEIVNHFMGKTLIIQRAYKRLVGENQNVNAAPLPSKPEDCHCFSTFFTSLDKVLTEIENGFGGNDQDVLCALGDITLSDLPTSDSFDLVVRYYNLDKELLQADQRLFIQFKIAHLQQSRKKLQKSLKHCTKTTSMK